MASALRRPASDLRGQLQRGHAGFDFYQLVRLLLRPGQGHPANTTGAHGDPIPPLRFKGELSAAFPGHEVSGWKTEGEDGPVALATPNYSIAGAMGPLPDPYGEWARDRAARGDRAMGDFLDLFNHRINTLRFEIKARQQPGLSTSDDPEQTPLGRDLAALLGCCDPDLPNPLPLPRRALLALTGLLADQRRSPTALIRVLGAFVQAPVALEPYVGNWFAIAEEDQIRLGKRRNRLGIDTPLGQRAWDEQAGIGLSIGPLPRARFEALLPGGEGHAGFKALLHFLTGRSLDCHIRLQTQPWDARLQPRATHLGAQARLGDAPLLARAPSPRLGLDAWLGDGADLPDHPPSEVRFIIPAFAGQEAA